uniref:hypothetical protein n=1 Tax=Lithothamnion corallioides TaxID=1277934 RepID=UPI0023EF8772|nr:hypothetical protein P6G75_pgp042 [Lithothamnion corallioides]WEA76999.1 hypothetical protein [Lithothamnion corallioides]
MNFQKVKQPVYLHNRRTDSLVSQMVHVNQNDLLRQNIKTVIVKGISNANLKKIIFQHLNINHIFTQKKYLSFYKLNFIINKLRYSGFFNKISASYLSFNNHPYLIIQLNLNPILQEILIQNVDELKVPKKYLISILQKQIGYPKSLKIINNMIHKIQSWYFIRGYKWVKVSYKICYSNRRKIEIAILESQISDIEIHCINGISQIYKKEIESFILNQLNIIRGQSLNFYNIELGIIKLKTQKLILSCNYEVQYTNKNTLKIIIKYRCLEDRISYFFNRSIYLHYQLLDSICKEAYMAFNDILNSFDSSIYWKQIRNIYLCLQYQVNSSTFNNLSYNNLFLSNFLQIKDIIKYKNQDDAFIILKNNLKFKHHINHLNNFFTNLIIYLEKYQRKTSIIISYNYPIVKNNQYHEKYSLLSTFQNIFKIKSSIFKAIFEQVKYKKKFFDNDYISYGTDIMFTHNLSSDIYIFQKLSLFDNIYDKNLLYRKNLPENLYKFFRLTNNTLKNKVYTIHQKFIYYIIDIKSNALNFKDRLIPSNLWNFSISAYTPLLFNSKEFNRSKRINHLINIQHSRIISFSSNTLNALTNTFIFNIDFKTFLGAVRYIPVNVLNFFNNWQIFQNSSADSTIKIYPYLYTNIEYHIYKQYNICLFLFLDHKQYFNLNHIDHEINQIKGGLYLFGTGLEISLPIHQIPVIKTKYEMNINGNCRLYTKLYFK